MTVLELLWASPIQAPKHGASFGPWPKEACDRKRQSSAGRICKLRCSMSRTAGPLFLYPGSDVTRTHSDLWPERLNNTIWA